MTSAEPIIGTIKKQSIAAPEMQPVGAINAPTTINIPTAISAMPIAGEISSLTAAAVVTMTSGMLNRRTTAICKSAATITIGIAVLLMARGGFRLAEAGDQEGNRTSSTVFTHKEKTVGDVTALAPAEREADPSMRATVADATVGIAGGTTGARKRAPDVLATRTGIGRLAAGTGLTGLAGIKVAGTITTISRVLTVTRTTIPILLQIVALPHAIPAQNAIPPTPHLRHFQFHGRTAPIRISSR